MDAAERKRIISLGFVNAYLLSAEGGFVLIDTGLPGQWDALEAALASAGCAPGRRRLVVLTHGDWDHVGNAVRLRERFSAPLAMHALDLPMAEKGLWPERRARTVSARLVMLLARIRLKLERNKADLPLFSPDLLLSDGQSLEPYGLAARVLHLPGHTKGSIGVLTAEGELFSGDTLIRRKKPERAVFVDDEAQLEASVARLKTLGVRCVYPGHGAPFAAGTLDV